MSIVFYCKDFVSPAMICVMARKVFLGIRINLELKKALEQIGDAEERSVSQICELLLRNGVESYRKEGVKHIHSSRFKKEAASQ
jgi:hypothetical protein